MPENNTPVNSTSVQNLNNIHFVVMAIEYVLRYEAYCMSNWRTVGVRLKEEQLATLNQRLKQLGYSSLNEFVG